MLRRLLTLTAITILAPVALAQHRHESAPVPTHGSHALPGGGAEGEAKTDEPETTDEPKWDVNDPPGPVASIPIDVAEGTWMNLDVSPDGKEIVFDLLGDLYVVPDSGGDAKKLTSGMSWDMQPAWSPNGKWIAFTSDRAGGDNVWIVNRDGSSPVQVTKESFRLLSSPAWTPDSEFIVARKHFTSRRSIGAGEMWLYHRSGGDGIQMTKKPNEQKDVGEPAFSPDGRYLYFSQDTTPGGTFEYNKDPNGEIYTIRRLDRETGRLESFVDGPGGAIRPTPSPDGTKLAFVRRERYKSVLQVMDLESGAITKLFDGLDRDMQETWAIHGVYARLAWTPDNRSIVFWADGGIHRIDVATRAVTKIPFRVKDTRETRAAVRFPIEVAPETFDVRMLRWVEVSPDGTRVVFQALGYLWVRDLPNGKARRLTKQTDDFEFYPSWSRDGKSIVYATWNDARYGSVRVVAAGGGEGRAVTKNPGHYLEPAFSPDGRKIVYRKAAGNAFIGPLWSFDTGLYVVPVAGGEPKLVTRSGRAPQFGASSDRVFFLDSGEDDARLLKSIALDGSDERTHAKSAEATAMAVSPDEKWLAFTEKFNAWITPLVATGQTVDIAPKSKGLPTARVSRDAGEYIHWSGDSRTLRWALGPDLFSRELKDAFAFIAGAPEELPEAPKEGIRIGFSHDYETPKGVVALAGGRVVTMKGDEIIEDGVVVIERNRIMAVGSRGEVTIPAGAKTIDVSGKTVLPGLIDVHWHGGMGSRQITPRQNYYLYSSLAFGVTTIHDPSNDTAEIFAVSEMAKAGAIVSPRVYSTGTILYGAKAPFTATVDSLDDALSHLRRMKAVGAFTVKSYNQPRRDQRQQVLEAARQLGMMVVPEGGSLFGHNMNMVVDGHTGIEHSIPVAKIYDDVRQLWGTTEVGYTPTLIVGYGGLWGENYWYAKTKVWENERLMRFVPREVVDPRSRRRVEAPDDEWNHVSNASVANDLSKSGVRVLIGAHGQREGLGAHWETWMLVQGGMSPHEALRSATIDGAWYLGLDRDLGSLEPGKLADVIVVDGDVLSDIRRSEKVDYTVINGRVYEALTMKQVWPEEKAPAKFWFE